MNREKYLAAVARALLNEGSDDMLSSAEEDLADSAWAGGDEIEATVAAILKRRGVR